MAEILDIIAKKRDGRRLENEEISYVVDAYVTGKVAHEQMSSLLMAIVINGLDEGETAALCRAYVGSGTTLNYEGLDRKTTDKHSTGGVGDKITLILTPMVIALGAAVPQLSGRGLGHTGGTLDKLESIDGFKTDLSSRQMLQQIREVGGFICAASDELAPADRLIYALRDVTGTVSSIPLIASSIMSKKIAEGTDALVLDVKVGGGAFMKEESSARQLAEAMMNIGRSCGLQTRVVLSSMEEPLGNSAGNALEVMESLEVLSGGGPRDVRSLCELLATEMLEAAGLSSDGVDRVLDDGRAMDAFEKLVAAQGGNLGKRLPKAPLVERVLADRDGYVESVSAIEVAMAAWKLGAGRARKEDTIDHAAGVVWTKKSGEVVRAGEVVLELHASSEEKLESGLTHARNAVRISNVRPEPGPLVLDILR